MAKAARCAAHMLMRPKKLPGSEKEVRTINSNSGISESLRPLGKVMGTKTDFPVVVSPHILQKIDMTYSNKLNVQP